MKRGADGGGNRAQKRGRGPPGDAGPRSRAAPGELGPHALKVLVPDRLVVVVMGGRGARLHEIEQETRTHLQFSQRNDFFPDTELRVCIVSGQDGQCILDAADLLLEHVRTLAEEERPSIALPDGIGDFAAGQSDGDIVFRLALATQSASRIIGNKGEVIKALRESSGARVEIAQQGLVAGHQLTEIIGSKEQVKEVLLEINDCVQSDVDQGWFGQWASQRGFLEEARGKGDKKGSGGKGAKNGPKKEWKGGWTPPEEDWEKTIFVGHLTQDTDNDALEDYFAKFGGVVSADVRYDHLTKNSKGFGFVVFVDPDGAEQALDHAEAHVIDGQEVDVKRYEPEGAPDGRDDYAAAQEQPEETFAKEPRRSKRGGKNRNGHSRAAPAYAVPEHDDEFNIDWFNNIASDVPVDYTVLQYSVSCTLPDSKCGSIIGRGGEHLKQVERTTGATIEVEKKHPKDNGPEAYRTITIVGTMYQVYAAHMMMMRNYNDAEVEREQEVAEKDATVSDLQRQIDALKAKVAQVNQEKGGGKGCNGTGKGGKGGGGKRR